MTAIASQLPQPIVTYLARFSARRRAQRVARAMGLAVLFTLTWALLWCLLDRLTALPAIVRLVLLAVNITVAIVLLARPIAALLRTRDWIGLARDVEMREARWGERLWTVASRSLGPVRLTGSPQLLAALSQQVAGQAAASDARRLLPWRKAARPSVLSLIVAIAWASLAQIDVLDLSRLARRYATPLAAIAPAATTRLLIMPGSVDLPAGQTLRVRAAATRLGDSTPELHYRAHGHDWTRVEMVRVRDGEFEAHVSDVQLDLEYHVVGGDARSATYRVEVLNKPAVAALRVRLAYPAYTRLAAADVTVVDGVIEAPAGTQATVVIESTEPLAEATMMIGGVATPTEPTDRPNVRRATVTIRDDRRFSIRMSSIHGVEGAFRGGAIRAIPDRAPIVLLEAPASQNSAALEFSAADDFGLARVDAEITVAGRQRTLALPLGQNRREHRGIVNLDAATIGASAGDAVTLRLRAEDVSGQFAVTSPIQVVAASAAAPAPPDAAAPDVEPALPLVPSGYADELRAYFDAIRKSSGD